MYFGVTKQESGEFGVGFTNWLVVTGEELAQRLVLCFAALGGDTVGPTAGGYLG